MHATLRVGSFTELTFAFRFYQVTLGCFAGAGSEGGATDENETIDCASHTVVDRLAFFVLARVVFCSELLA